MWHFLLTLIGLMGLLFGLRFALTFHGRREARRWEAGVTRLARRPCPNCHRPFERESTFLQHAAACQVDLQGQPFSPRFVIVCSSCHFLNSFDESGRAQFGPGVHFDCDEMQRTEERWEEMAREMACPRCGAGYPTWSGREWSGADQPLGSRSPVMCCPNCGAEAFVMDDAGVPRADGVWFEDRWWKPQENG